MSVYSYGQIADYLTTGYWHAIGQEPHRFQSPSIKVYLEDLTLPEQQLARQSLTAWELVSPVRFSFVETAGDAQITFSNTQRHATSLTDHEDGWIKSTHINVPHAWFSGFGGGINSHTRYTYLHEIGHALGLGHSGHYNVSAEYGIDNHYENDSWQASIMSYFDQQENTFINATLAPPSTPMIADILAIQSLYGSEPEYEGDTVWGANSNLETGLKGFFFLLFDNSHKQPPIAFTIHDTGGQDTLDLSNETVQQKIDLRPMAISDVGGGIGNMVISHSTVIETAIGGKKGDRIIGNDADNLLDGGKGNDKLFGHDGDDTLIGRGGKDQLFGDDGHDILKAGVKNDQLKGGHGNDTLLGGSGNDWLSGNQGGDVLDGGKGNDTLIGNGGNDVFVFQSGNDLINDFEDDSDTIRIAASLLPDGSGSIANILDQYAESTAGGVLLDFQNGHSLFVARVADMSTLEDDLLFV